VYFLVDSDDECRIGHQDYEHEPIIELESFDRALEHGTRNEASYRHPHAAAVPDP
jgi:hypothetical protein